jgi:hypothetical protein
MHRFSQYFSAEVREASTLLATPVFLQRNPICASPGFLIIRALKIKSPVWDDSGIDGMPAEM